MEISQTKLAALVEGMADEPRVSIDDEVYAIIVSRRANPEVKDDLLAMLMGARDEGAGQGMTDRQLRDAVLMVMKDRREA